jgi:hypothetical protein
MFLCHIYGTEQIGIFTPPAKWQYIMLPETASYIKATFIDNNGSSLKPSINIATEDISISEAAYIKAAKACHDEDPSTNWRKIGKITTLAGIATLAEIDSQNNFGKLKMLQMIFVKDKKAYIITGASKKEDFASCAQKILQAIRSFRLIDKKPLAAIKENKEIAAIKKQMTQEQWEYLQTFIFTNTYIPK